MYDLDLPPNVSFEIPKYEEYKIKKGTSNEVKVNNPSSYSAPKKEEGGIKGFLTGYLTEIKSLNPNLIRFNRVMKALCRILIKNFNIKSQNLQI